jgi:arsenate reductase (thioredoxin)
MTLENYPSEKPQLQARPVTSLGVKKPRARHPSTAAAQHPYHRRMHNPPTNVLFLSRENACRSLLAEACVQHLAVPHLRAYSCGVPHLIAERPYGWTLVALQTAGISAHDLWCKGWTDFTRNGSLKVDFVIAMDAATAVEHPSWPGQPVTALWDYPAVTKKQKHILSPGLSTIQTLHSLRRRIELLSILVARSSARSDLRHDLRDLAYL